MMKNITIFLPDKYIALLDLAVRKGLYPNRSEMIRVAIRDILKEELPVESSIWKDKDYHKPHTMQELMRMN